LLAFCNDRQEVEKLIGRIEVNTPSGKLF
jgi:hypothetical protein